MQLLFNFLDILKLTDNTIIIFTADHDELLSSHRGLTGKGATTYRFDRLVSGTHWVVPTMPLGIGIPFQKHRLHLSLSLRNQLKQINYICRLLNFSEAHCYILQ